MLSPSLLNFSTLFGGGKGGGLKKSSSYMHIIVWKTQSKISATDEENEDKNNGTSQIILSMIVEWEIKNTLVAMETVKKTRYN